MKTYLTLLFLGVSLMSLFSQETVDVVYLKDGSIYKGKVVNDTSDVIKIETLCHNTLVFESNSILKQESEVFISDRTIKTKGYFGFISGGVLVGSTQNELRAPFSALFENNYRINKYSAVGFMTGVEMLNEATVPIAFNAKALYPLIGGTTLFLGGSIGYSISAEEAKDEIFVITDSYGGVLANVEVGILFPSNGHLSFFIAGGFRYNELSYTREDWQLTKVDRTIYYNRISVRVGVYFY